MIDVKLMPEVKLVFRSMTEPYSTLESLANTLQEVALQLLDGKDCNISVTVE